MLFVLIIIIFIALISFFGDYKSKEIEKDKEQWKKITGNKYY